MLLSCFKIFNFFLELGCHLVILVADLRHAPREHLKCLKFVHILRVGAVVVWRLGTGIHGSENILLLLFLLNRLLFFDHLHLLRTLLQFFEGFPLSLFVVMLRQRIN
jgi:hypothetical protein